MKAILLAVAAACLAVPSQTVDVKVVGDETSGIFTKIISDPPGAASDAEVYSADDTVEPIFYDAQGRRKSSRRKQQGSYLEQPNRYQNQNQKHFSANSIRRQQTQASIKYDNFGRPIQNFGNQANRPSNIHQNTLTAGQGGNIPINQFSQRPVGFSQGNLAGLGSISGQPTHSSLIGQQNNQQFGASRPTTGQQFGASRPTAGQQFGASRPTTGQQFGASRPTTGQQFGLSRPTTGQQFGLSRPTTGQQFGASRPTTGQQFGLSRPTTGQQFGLSRPTTGQQFGLSRPTTGQQFGASRPTTGQQFGASRHTTGQQFGASRPTTGQLFPNQFASQQTANQLSQQTTSSGGTGIPIASQFGQQFGTSSASQFGQFGQGSTQIGSGQVRPFDEQRVTQFGQQATNQFAQPGINQFIQNSGTPFGQQKNNQLGQQSGTGQFRPQPGSGLSGQRTDDQFRQQQINKFGQQSGSHFGQQANTQFGQQGISQAGQRFPGQQSGFQQGVHAVGNQFNRINEQSSGIIGNPLRGNEIDSQRTGHAG